jgi:hypothetical protein
MSLLPLLSLPDEKIDIVTDAVRNLCETRRCDVTGARGRSAMETAVAIALASDRLTVADLSARLEENLRASD